VRLSGAEFTELEGVLSDAVIHCIGRATAAVRAST
jgi:hypothetical protein